jgi:hypothetical protein
MHPQKAEVLGKLTDASRAFDEAIGRVRQVALHPSRHGWRRSIGALATLPILGMGAMIVDAGEVAVRRSSDGEWDESSPNDLPSAPPNEL